MIFECRRARDAGERKRWAAGLTLVVGEEVKERGDILKGWQLKAQR